MAKSDTRHRIFEEAARLFQEKGYLATTLRELAERLNLKVSSLYTHIGSKEELLQKICFDNARHYLEGMKAAENLAASPKEKIACLISMHIRFAVEDATSVTIFNDEWRHLSQPWLGDFLAMRKDYERRFAKILQEGMDAGEFEPMNVTVTMFTILTSVRWLHRWFPEKRGISLKALEAEILKLLMQGLVKK